MMKPALLHAGMHKTGSSAIQRAIRGLDQGGVKAVDWRGENHSGMIALLFYDPVEEFRVFKMKSQPREALLADRAIWSARLDAQLRNPAIRLPILSAEFLSATSTDVLERLRSFWTACGRQPQILLYIRPPLTFMASSFQQNLKEPHSKQRRFDSYWPSYHRRIAPIDEVFGEENVSLRLFHRGALLGGDVVTDFSEIIGVELPRYNDVNESMSLEATALLYVYEHIGPGMPSGTPATMRGNAQFIDAVRTIGTTRFAFGPRITSSLVTNNKADLDWIARRMGIDMLAVDQGKEKKDLYALRSLDELEGIAAQALPRLQVLVAAEGGADALDDGPSKGTPGVIHALGILREIKTTAFESQGRKGNAKTRI